MLLDLTLRVTPEMTADAQANERIARVGHLGTHFDVMDKEFPLEYTERPGIVFDLRGFAGEEIDLLQLDLDRVKAGDFVAFCTGYIEQVPYGSRAYFSGHPQLSERLIDQLLARRVAIIGVDFAGLRRGAQHTPTDRRCAERGTFVVENLCNLGSLARAIGPERRTFCTYPMNWAGLSGLPCRVVARG